MEYYHCLDEDKDCHGCVCSPNYDEKCDIKAYNKCFQNSFPPVCLEKDKIINCGTHFEWLMKKALEDGGKNE